MLFGYDVLFEVLAAGRTPGKRWPGSASSRATPGPSGSSASAARNLLRLVDFLPAVYLAGSISILASRENQRLGDMVAGTIVVREHAGSSRRRGLPSAVPEISDELAASDVSGLGETELVAVRRFLERRHEIDGAARARIAADLEHRLRPRVAGIPESYRGEQFLEALAAVKASRT